MYIYIHNNDSNVVSQIAELEQIEDLEQIEELSARTSQYKIHFIRSILDTQLCTPNKS